MTMDKRYGHQKKKKKWCFFYLEKYPIWEEVDSFFAIFLLIFPTNKPSVSAPASLPLFRTEERLGDERNIGVRDLDGKQPASHTVYQEPTRILTHHWDEMWRHGKPCVRGYRLKAPPGNHRAESDMGNMNP